MYKKLSAQKNILLFLAATALAGCSHDYHDLNTDRAKLANDIAYDGKLKNVVVESEPFLITTYSRVSNPSAAARIYIEGDGFAWRTRRSPSLDPTPKNPVGLKLAALDDAENVIYIARPCQYTKLSDDTNSCNVRYWTSERFSKEVLSSLYNVIDFYKQKYNIQHFELIGFSGGANIAGLITAHRKDVISLRTVAGNVDNEAFIEYHNVSEMPYSLDMAEFAGNLRPIPQIHFIGMEDKIIPVDIARSYEAKLYDTRCFKARQVEASHSIGWDRYWKQLLIEKPECK